MVKQEKPTVTPSSRPAPKAKPEPLKTPVDVLVLLMPKGGSDFVIHEKSCRSYKGQKAKSSYAGLQDYALTQVVNQLEIIRDVWDDQIREEFEEDPKNEGKDYAEASWGWLNQHGYVDSVGFHTCLDGLPQQAKNAIKTANTKKAAKQELASLVAEATARMLAELLDEATATDPDSPYASSAPVVTGGFKDDEEIRQCVAQWLHGLPCDRERWVASGMAIPDRSDWAGFIAKLNAASDGAAPELSDSDEPQDGSDAEADEDGSDADETEEDTEAAE
jgi:hypothetical protein